MSPRLALSVAVDIIAAPMRGRVCHSGLFVLLAMTVVVAGAASACVSHVHTRTYADWVARTASEQPQKHGAHAPAEEVEAPLRRAEFAAVMSTTLGSLAMNAAVATPVVFTPLDMVPPPKSRRLYARLSIAASTEGPFRIERGFAIRGRSRELVWLEGSEEPVDNATSGPHRLELAVDPNGNGSADFPDLGPYDLVAVRIAPKAPHSEAEWRFQLYDHTGFYNAGGTYDVEMAPKYEWRSFDAHCRVKRGVAVVVWTAGTGKERVAVAVRAVNLSDQARELEVRSAELVLEPGTAAVEGKTIVASFDDRRRRETLPAGEAKTIPLWFEFENEEFWNRGGHLGKVVIRYSITGDGLDAGAPTTLELPLQQRRSRDHCRIPKGIEAEGVPGDCEKP